MVSSAAHVHSDGELPDSRDHYSVESSSPEGQLVSIGYPRVIRPRPFGTGVPVMVHHGGVGPTPVRSPLVVPPIRLHDQSTQKCGGANLVTRSLQSSASSGAGATHRLMAEWKAARCGFQPGGGFA
ncbi:unnamed protein product [Phytophthora fragariaefolia]|uniref:Unnamed protein product n=1 Tax=Phytophthora fragariaefolia TaxID=1490495 RepID=A0A9W6TXJ8_9STRA|nr:unnamed protein product [Phytophthora fragariaefolia]